MRRTLLYSFNMRTIKAFFLFLAFLFSLTAESKDHDIDLDWFNDDSEFDSLLINEGELKFISPVLNTKVLHSETTLSILRSSLETGWVEMEQCYRNLDPVGKTDVVYRYKEIKNLKIKSFQHIRQAIVVDQSIHLEDIGQSASLCVQAMVKILKKSGLNAYKLSNGPYHRSFFDGYYPYHITLTINYPSDLIQFRNMLPVTQPLFKVITKTKQLLIDTWFEGILKIDIEFIEY